MKRENIIDEFKGQYDDFTVKVLTRYIEEFDMCFGKYLPAEEVIKRLKNRIKYNIEIIDEYIYGNTDGQYDINDEKVRLHKDVLENEEYCAYLTFHELTHAITTKDLPDRRIMGFSFITNMLGQGLNEAMTEWLTKIRNEKVNAIGESNYETIVEQIRHLSFIIGNEKLLNCFFYEPENLKKFLEEKGINYAEVEEAFYRFKGKDVEVMRMGSVKTIDDVGHYDLYKQAQILFDNFSNGIGEVSTPYDLYKKYQLLGEYIRPELNLNNIMEYHYYTHLINDGISLLKKGIPQSQIVKTLKILNISSEKFNLYNKINQELPKEDKRKMAIYLYKLHEKNSNQYYDFICPNVNWIYGMFSETNLVQEDSLYDTRKYSMLGKFLSEHSDYEYEETSIKKYDSSKGLGIYCFEVGNQKKFIYTTQNNPVEKLGKDKFKIVTDTGYILLDEEKGIYESNTTQDKPLTLSETYFQPSQLENLQYCMTEEGIEEETKKIYKKKIDAIEEKISKKNRSI